MNIPTLDREAILARAVELHETRNANAKRNGWMTQEFDGAERVFCIQAATDALNEEAYQADLAAHRAATEADLDAQLAAMTDAQLDANVARCDFEATGRYHPATIKAAKLERSYYVKEQFRRSVAAGADPFFASQAAVLALVTGALAASSTPLVREGSEHQMEAVQ